MHDSGSHHLSVRKRISKKLEPFPHPDALKRYLDRLMLLVAIGGPVVLIPQVYQVLMLKDASDLSLVTWGMWQVFNFLWLTYGIVHKELPIIIANSCYIVLHTIIIWAIFTY